MDQKIKILMPKFFIVLEKDKQIELYKGEYIELMDEHTKFLKKSIDLQERVSKLESVLSSKKEGSATSPLINSH